MISMHNIEYIQVRLASPERILSWGERELPGGKRVGEVTKSETINYRTLKPEMDGLFCERIFGPVKDWECHCGRFKGKVQPKKTPTYCPNCGVELTDAKVRRRRIGYIKLAYPVTHVWYLKGRPSYIPALLDLSRKYVESLVYCTHSVPIEESNGNVCLEKTSHWSDYQWEETDNFLLGREEQNDHFLSTTWVDPSTQVNWSQEEIGPSMGAEAIYTLLKEIDLPTLAHDLQTELRYLKYDLDVKGISEEEKMHKKAKLVRRIKIVNHFLRTESRPEWMILTCLPVLPPDLRPMIQLEGGRFAASDLNDLYRRVLNRNNRFYKLHLNGSPPTVLRSERRMLQEAVDALLDNGKLAKPVLGPNKRPLKSLADIIKGKQGRFRQNLLGKRVDYSGRSVIVVGPHLSLHECGLPEEMALELFQPFVIHDLLRSHVASNIRTAKKLIQKRDPMISDILNKVCESYPILLNRAPTLHRLGIQAFHARLVEGRAIQLHPLVCPAFNADFDGDQMAVHIPLSQEAKMEARIMMLASHNLLSPATGQPIAMPSQDMVLGFYYLTTSNPRLQGKAGHYFSNYQDAIQKYQDGHLDVHSPIWVEWTGSLESNTSSQEPMELQIDQQGNTWEIFSDLQWYFPTIRSQIPVPKKQLYSSYGCPQWRLLFYTPNRVSNKQLWKKQYISTTPGRILFNELLQPFLTQELKGAKRRLVTNSKESKEN
uniref:DNA-directed RNA polymerase subunit beta' n=1 Tax=Nephroselmis astigmatica TaxID=259378 RepID=A0A088CKE3_9CHLO|nr:beta' subunit of RNA polymerase [Nephroselmis astigmatica]AID67724.1 beta' subunit of RNA polymerase [Nephroselmis astigmatica]